MDTWILIQCALRQQPWGFTHTHTLSFMFIQTSLLINIWICHTFKFSASGHTHTSGSSSTTSTHPSLLCIIPLSFIFFSSLSFLPLSSLHALHIPPPLPPPPSSSFLLSRSTGLIFSCITWHAKQGSRHTQTDTHMHKMPFSHSVSEAVECKSCFCIYGVRNINRHFC